MLRYRKGDVHAFEQLYERHKGALFRYFLRQCSQRAVAEELFQDVWTNLVRSRDRYRVRAKFTTLLYRMAQNRLIDHWRSASANPGHDAAFSDTDIDPPDGGSPLHEQLATERQAAKLRRAIAGLPAEQRDAFLLHEEGGLRLEQIAQITGTGGETVKSRLRYAVAKLRDVLSSES